METALLSQRLERLRTAPGRNVRPPPARADHAASLAAALGGHVRNGVVVLEESVAVPVDRSALAALPYDIPADARLVCLDLETTGLATAAGTVAFLVGLGWWERERLTVRQLVLPDHADEMALLEAVAEALPPDAWLVTYNGRCFDWPLLITRFRMHRRDRPPLAGHTDLLPIARALWKHRTGSARLAVIEHEICGVRRTDDLPGAFIPERYFGYLHTRRDDLLRAPVEHNRQDIISLGRLVARLARMSRSEAWPETHAGDLYGLARAMIRRGRGDGALLVLETAMASDRWQVRQPATVVLHRHLAAERARLLARLGRRQEAVEAWTDIARRGGPGAGAAWLSVARHREHFERDVAGALTACHEAAAVAGRARAWGNPLHAVERDLEHRLPRLSRKAFAQRRQVRIAA
jgi:uncharacterized protein YprB with RNaseH-like and TPR domain